MMTVCTWRAGVCVNLSLDHCVITLSEDGMARFSGDGVHRYTPRAREVFDVTGAGDTVVATMAVTMAAGHSVPEACKIANIAAGIKVAKLGAATVSLAELNNELSGIRHIPTPNEKLNDFRLTPVGLSAWLSM